MNIIETLREASIIELFKLKSFSSCFTVWARKIETLASSRTPRQIMDLGDSLSEIFSLTKNEGRSQSDVSGGGSAWEALICWYLNLCLIGRRTVVIKHKKDLIPAPVSDAITVNYSNFVSNTESDLIAITFPDELEYNINRNNIVVFDANNIPVSIAIGKHYNRKPILDALCHRDFSKLEIHIIQCKTNWNDNAQIPMLWDMVYSAKEFKTNITVGRNGYFIHDASRFTYSFVTVPTSRMDSVNSNSTCVRRVAQISGGNYWGKPTMSGVSSSVKEILSRNFATGHSNSVLITLGVELLKLDTDYKYFGL
jgi:hypothetical protein